MNSKEPAFTWLSCCCYGREARQGRKNLPIPIFNLSNSFSLPPLPHFLSARKLGRQKKKKPTSPQLSVFIHLSAIFLNFFVATQEWGYRNKQSIHVAVYVTHWRQYPDYNITLGVPNTEAADQYQAVGHTRPHRGNKLTFFLFYLSSVSEQCFILKDDRILSITSVYDSCLTHVKMLVSVTWHMNANIKFTNKQNEQNKTSLESFFAKGKKPSDKTVEERLTKKNLHLTDKEAYLKYGFITGDYHTPNPLCITYGNCVSNEAMKPWVDSYLV